jgi:transposase-like protein
MSEQDFDTSTHATRVSRPLTPEQRVRKQARFFKAYRESGNIKASCKAAGINRQTFYNWRDQDEVFAAQLPDAREDACDTLEMAAYERAVNGVESYIVSMGRMVYEEIPAFDEAGKPLLGKDGEQIMLRGKPLTERKYSDGLLTTLLKANLPKKYKDKMELTGKDDGPIEFETDWGGGSLDMEDEEDEG